MMPFNHLILCHLFLLPSVFLKHELAFTIRCPKYWSFSFSICPSHEYSGLISFRIDRFDLLAIQKTLKSLLQHHTLKASFLWPSLWSISHTHTWLLEKPQLWLYGPLLAKWYLCFLICCLGIQHQKYHKHGQLGQIMKNKNHNILLLKHISSLLLTFLWWTRKSS